MSSLSSAMKEDHLDSSTHDQNSSAYPVPSSPSPSSLQSDSTGSENPGNSEQDVQVEDAPKASAARKRKRRNDLIVSGPVVSPVIPGSTMRRSSRRFKTSDNSSSESDTSRGSGVSAGSKIPRVDGHAVLKDGRRGMIRREK